MTSTRLHDAAGTRYARVASTLRASASSETDSTGLPMPPTDSRRDAALEKYWQASSALAAAPRKDKGHQTRDEKILSYQHMIEGERGSKYQHADYRPGGGTQIAGTTTQTPTMDADFNNPKFWVNASTVLGKGAPPIRGAIGGDRAFRLA